VRIIKAYIFIIGLFIGYFLNLVIDNMSDEKSTIRKHVIIDFINAVLYLAVYYVYGLSYYTIKYCIFVSIMFVIAVIDIKTKYVYLKVSAFSMILALILDLYEWFILKEQLQKYILGAVLAFGIFFCIVKVTKSMGEGDIEAAVICGLFLGGRYTLLAIILSFIIGGSCGIFLMTLRNKSKKYEIAFTPYIALGSYMAIFVGEFLINWYLKCY